MRGQDLLAVSVFILLHLVCVLPQQQEQHFITLQVGERPRSDNLAVEEDHNVETGQQQNHAAAAVPMDSSSFSVQLLMLQRLRKDELRRRAIAATISLATNGFTKSDLKPSSSSVAAASAEEFESPLISGIAGGSGDYFARIGVGTPAREVFMVADTGSDVSWLQCAPCRRCYRQQDPLFNPSLSSSFKRVTCESSICGQLKVKGCTRRNMCMYQVSYGDGSFTVGDFSTETLSFGSHTVSNVAMGCGRNNQGLFHGAAGLLGLGRGPLSFPSQTASVFSYCLPRRESTKPASLIFGPSAVPSSAKFTRLVPNRRLDTYYYVALSQIRVGGSALKIPSDAFAMGSRGTGGVIIDSGTAITRLTTPAYDALRDAFQSMVDFPAAPAISLFDTCYDLSSMKTARLPAVVLEFEGGASMPLPADGILVNVDDEGTYCLAFAPEDEAFSIIGNVQQQTFRISIDNEKKQMGIAPDQCS